MNTKRTKARRGWELLGEAAGKLEILYSYQLYRIAKAINPALEDFQGRMVIMDDLRWLDEPRLSGSLNQLARLSMHDFGALRALVFWREEIADGQSSRISHDVRLCYEFPGGEKRGSIWLDAATGLPWLPHACYTFLPDPERSRRMNEQLAADAKLARAVVAQITEEENTSFMWQYGPQDYKQEREVEILQFSRRKNKKAEWVVEKVFATRYHPAGSLLPKDEQEAFRVQFLAKQQEAVAA